MKKESIKKSRMTNQRRVVYEELKKLTSHPTADELYRVVKKRIPKISLGTVYRNLNLLVKTGVIRRLYFSDSIYRF
ncbi:MAG: transcriptional repressor, partial [candidate division Zixibacteria bacterium 4484_95]